MVADVWNLQHPGTHQCCVPVSLLVLGVPVKLLGHPMPWVSQLFRGASHLCVAQPAPDASTAKPAAAAAQPAAAVASAARPQSAFAAATKPA